jgi:hypothetical protein
MGFGKRIPTGQPHLERRRSTREKLDATGEIIVPGQPPRRCLIADFSDTGARLQVPSLFGTPNSFELRAFGRIYTARVIRKAPRTLVVAFK